MIRLPCTGRWILLNSRSISSSLNLCNGNKSGSNDKTSLQKNHSPSMPPILPLYPHTRPKWTPLVALSGTLVSAIIVYLLMRKDDEGKGSSMVRIYEDLETAMEKSCSYFNKTLHQMKQTGAAASVLWKSLWSLMSSANHEVRTGFEFRVAALLADIAAASDIRRAALVGAGDGAVIDWLLETVATASGENLGTQAEAARALAFFIADPNVREAVFGRPSAVPNLLRFIFSAQPPKNQKERSSVDISDSLKGRSMLVAAIMEVITSHGESADKAYFRPLLPKNAEVRDIAAAIEVIENGDINGDEPPGSNGKGKKGIGIKVLEGTSVLGLPRTMRTEYSDVSYSKRVPRNIFGYANRNSAIIPGLWDDLHSERVGVPFAAWALANWAMASEGNRFNIQELDQDGRAVMSALLAPERSVKWHGILVTRLLLEDKNFPLNVSVSDWGSSILSTAHHASKSQDLPLAKMALAAFLVSIERSHQAREAVMTKGLPLMREIVRHTMKHKTIQESVAKALELLCHGELHMSREEGQKWSAILLPWVFSNKSSDTIQSSATRILSHILKNYGKFYVPISQGWLSMLLSETLTSKKTTIDEGNTQPRNDVKTQIDESNIVSATQIANQLATAVVNLAGKQLGAVTDGEDAFPLIDLFSLEPFAGPFKSLKKDKKPKIDAADSAFATIRGIKALTQICCDDSFCQQKLVDRGVLCLLRRFLLDDDYEQLAAIETYNASRGLEMQESYPILSFAASNKDSSCLRVPPIDHMRRHAARLLTVLSVLPKVQKAIIADETWCKWLEECASGRIPGCNDLKTQSYARATLLNVLCNSQTSKNSYKRDASGGNLSNENKSCHQFDDMIYLINPERPHWKCQNSSASMAESGSCSNLNFPPFDVVFVHGLLGGPFKSWRLSEDKCSTKSGLVEKIDEEAGKQGTFWPREWLSTDFPDARVFSLKYKV